MKLRVVFFALFSTLASSWAAAQVVNVSIDQTMPFEGGKEFGNVGAYEYVSGTLYGALDPEKPHNKLIHNIDKATLNDSGLVEYSADFALLRPVDPSRGNGTTIVEVPNRGHKLALEVYNYAAPAGMSSALSDPFLFRNGYSLGWVGWEGVALDGSVMRLKGPVAIGDEQDIREEFVFGSRYAADENKLRLTYTPVKAGLDTMRLTVRQRASDIPQTVPAKNWRFDGERTVEYIGPEKQFENGAIYDFWYRAKDPEILGVGFAAVRDFSSALKNQKTMFYPTKDEKLAQGLQANQKLIAVGVSQPARFLRHFLELGMNKDADDKKVFDGVMAYTAGVGKTAVNTIFGTPKRSRARHQDQRFNEMWFPYAHGVSTDHNDGLMNGLLSDDAYAPKLMEVNTSSEYRNKGASLLHTDSNGKSDLLIPPNVRLYALLGVQHTGRPNMPLKRGNCRFVQNPSNPTPMARAMLTALNDWVHNDILPPPSQVGSIEAQTLISPTDLKYPYLPAGTAGNIFTDIVTLEDWVDLNSPITKRYAVLVPSLDSDGNEVGGVKLPHLVAPLGTYTGWNLYAKPFPEREACHQYGAFFPFAKTKAERLLKGDPRMSLEERYPTREAYISLVTKAVQNLQSERLLLKEDADRYIENAKTAKLFDR